MSTFSFRDFSILLEKMHDVTDAGKEDINTLLECEIVKIDKNAGTVDIKLSLDFDTPVFSKIKVLQILNIETVLSVGDRGILLCPKNVKGNALDFDLNESFFLPTQTVKKINNYIGIVGKETTKIKISNQLASLYTIVDSIVEMLTSMLTAVNPILGGPGGPYTWFGDITAKYATIVNDLNSYKELLEKW